MKYLKEKKKKTLHTLKKTFVIIHLHVFINAQAILCAAGQQKVSMTLTNIALFVHICSTQFYYHDSTSIGYSIVMSYYVVPCSILFDSLSVMSIYAFFCTA